MTTHQKTLEDFQLHERVGYKLSRLSKLMQAMVEAGLAQHNISRMQWCVLAGVDIENHSSPSALADYMRVSRPAISRVLKNMEMEQLIERDIIGDDGRTRLLTVTEKGRKKIEAGWVHFKSTEAHFLAKLNAEQLAVLHATIQIMIDGENAELDDL